MAKVIWSDSALGDLRKIISYIGQFDEAAATKIATRLVDRGESPADFPDRGRPTGDGSRELTSVPPYVLRYAVTGGIVDILPLGHGRRRPA